MKQVMFFGIWRGFEEEVKEAEVETINQILTMLTNEEGRGKLGRVRLPEAMLLKSDFVEHLGGEAEIKKVAAPSTNYFPWGGDSSVGVQWDFGNPGSGRLFL